MSHLIGLRILLTISFMARLHHKKAWDAGNRFTSIHFAIPQIISEITISVEILIEKLLDKMIGA